MLVSCLCRVRQRDFTHYVYLCVCLHVRDMYAICARYACVSAGTSLFHSQGSAGTFSLSRTTCMRQRGHFQSFTLKAARRHLGMSVCRRRRSAGLQRVEFVGLLGFAFESGGLSRAARVCGPAVLWPCGPAVLWSCGCVLCCHAVSDACARPGTAPHHLLAAATREVALVALVFLSAHLSLVALEAWRWRLGAGGLALEAWRWRLGAGGLVARRRASPCSRRDAPVLYQCLSLLALLLARRGAAWLGVACGVASECSAGFGCRGPKKRRRADTEDEDTRGRRAAGSATWRHVLVRLHTRFVRCALLEHKPPELA